MFIIYSGVNMAEILLAHFVGQLMFLVSQTATYLIALLLIFKITIKGSIVLTSLLVMLQSLVGLCCGICILERFYRRSLKLMKFSFSNSGILISLSCDDEQFAMITAATYFTISIILGGVLWPQEAMPSFIRYGSYALPQTPALESLRNIFARGWGIDRPEVYGGFIGSFIWIVGLLFICFIVLRVR